MASPFYDPRKTQGTDGTLALTIERPQFSFERRKIERLLSLITRVDP